jgi:hypothetical protein
MLKTQLVVDKSTRRMLCLAPEKGRRQLQAVQEVEGAAASRDESRC